MQFVQFPNGRVWPLDHNNWISGTVLVPEGASTHDLEAFLDKVSEAATGSSVGLEDFAYESRGGDLFSFSGHAANLPDFEDPEADLDGHVLLDPASNPNDLTVLRNALMLQYDLSSVEADHAVASWEVGGEPDPKEIALPVLGSAREFRLPAHPEPCSQVRVVVDSFEIARWNSEEWASDPDAVMGALLGVAGKGVLRPLVNCPWRAKTHRRLGPGPAPSPNASRRPCSCSAAVPRPTRKPSRPGWIPSPRTTASKPLPSTTGPDGAKASSC